MLMRTLLFYVFFVAFFSHAFLNSYLKLLPSARTRPTQRLRLPMSKRQIVLDIETTGLFPAYGDRIIEIAAAEMINHRLTGNIFHHYLNPERKISAGAKKVHGISEQFLMDKLKFKDVADDLWAYLQGSELIIHNAPFDLKFLDIEFQLLQRAFSKITDVCTVIDTLPLARNKHRGKPNDLNALCARYNIDHSQREKHGALIDVRLLSKVYLALTTEKITPLASETSATHSELSHYASLTPVFFTGGNRAPEESVEEKISINNDPLPSMQHRFE